MDVKESLKILRTELDMTQLELANALGVTHKTVSRWELGNAFPKNKIAEEIIRFSKRKGASQRCTDNLEKSLHDGRKKMLRVSRSVLYPVDRESICDLVDGSHNAIYVCDLETDEMLYANHKAEEYAGKSFTAGEKCYHFLYDRNMPCRQCPKEQMKEHESTNYHMVSSKDGRHFLFRGRKMKWNGKAAHAQYFFEEKTDLEAADGFRTVVDEMDLGVCTCWVHDNGYVQMNYMSDGYFAVMGSSREKRTQYAGFGVMNAVCEADQAQVKETVLTASKKQCSFRMRYRVLMDDGGLKELNMRAKFIRRENDKSLYYCMVEDADWGIDKEQFGGDDND